MDSCEVTQFRIVIGQTLPLAHGNFVARWRKTQAINSLIYCHGSGRQLDCGPCMQNQNTWTDVAYGNGHFVAIISSDGENQIMWANRRFNDVASSGIYCQHYDFFYKQLFMATELFVAAGGGTNRIGYTTVISTDAWNVVDH